MTISVPLLEWIESVSDLVVTLSAGDKPTDKELADFRGICLTIRRDLMQAEESLERRIVE